MKDFCTKWAYIQFFFNTPMGITNGTKSELEGSEKAVGKFSKTEPERLLLLGGSLRRRSPSATDGNQSSP